MIEPAPKLSPEHPTGQRTIVVYGSKSSVVERYYNNALKNLNKDGGLSSYRFIGVDVTDKASNKGTDISWDGYYPADKFNAAVRGSKNNTIEINGIKITVDGVMIAVPTRDHLPIAKQWSGRDVNVWLEKPVVMPGELAKLEALNKEHPHTIFVVDCVRDGDALVEVLSRGLGKLKEKIGDLVSISGRLVEDNPLETGRDWLLDEKKNGGGLGMDMMPHVLTSAMRIFNLWGIKEPMMVEDAYLGSNRFTDTEAPPVDEAETYMTIKGHAGEIEFSFDAGKGLPVREPYYGICVEGTKGKVEIMTGTENFHSYTRTTTTGEDGQTETELTSLPGDDVGYQRAFREYFHMLKTPDDPEYNAKADVRFWESIQAVRIIADGYRRAKPFMVFYRNTDGSDPLTEGLAPMLKIAPEARRIEK